MTCGAQARGRDQRDFAVRFLGMAFRSRRTLRPLPSPIGVLDEANQNHDHRGDGSAAVTPSQTIHNAREKSPLFGSGLIPLKYQASDVADASKNKSGRYGSEFRWLRESSLVQQTLPCKQFVYTPRCFLSIALSVGAVFLAVSIPKAMAFLSLN
jgi:hypothetical protein